MKKIAFKTVKMSLNGNETDLDYKENMMSLLLIPSDPKGGASYAEMATVLPIHAKFKDASSYVLLEDAEHAELCTRLKSAKFVQNTPEIFEMIRSAVDAPEHLVEAEANKNGAS